MARTKRAININIPLLDLVKTDEERTLLRESISILELTRGDRFISEGDEIDALYYLHSGKVKLFKGGLGAQIQLLSVAISDRFFGMRAYFSGGVHRLSAIAFGAAYVVRIPITTIEQLMHTCPDIARYFLKALSEELDIHEARNLTLMHKHMRGRLADTLLMLADYYGYQEDQQTIDVNLSRGDMAALSNMTLSNVSRTLSLFSRERIIGLNKRNIRIIDRPALEQISRQG